MITDKQLDLEHIVVDRSPELMRRASSGTIRPMQYKDEITSGDIATSTRGDGAICALAQVCGRVWPGAKEISISGERPYVIAADDEKIFLTLASEVVEWIGKFDRGEDVEPIAITIH